MPRSWGALSFFTLGRAQNASGAPAWTASVVLARRASSTCPALGLGLTDDAASQASPCSSRRLLNNLRQVSNKVPAVQPQRQLRLPQIRAGDGARLRAGLPALRIRTGRVATSSEGKRQRIWRQVLFSAAVKERTTATILKDNVKDILTRHSGPYRTPFADYLSRSVTLVCDSHADFDRLFGLQASYQSTSVDMTSMHSKVASAEKDGDQYHLVADLVHRIIST